MGIFVLSQIVGCAYNKSKTGVIYDYSHKSIERNDASSMSKFDGFMVLIRPQKNIVCIGCFLVFYGKKGKAGVVVLFLLLIKALMILKCLLGFCVL